jgi:hypothetical protein
MFSRCEAGVGGVSTLLFSFTRLAPLPTHDPEISPAGFSFLLLREERPSATPQQCSFGLVLSQGLPLPLKGYLKAYACYKHVTSLDKDAQGCIEGCEVMRT